MVKISKTLINKLQNIYYTAKDPNSFGSVNKLHSALQKKYDKDLIKEWLASQDTYTLHKYKKRRFKREPVYVPNGNNLFQADLCDMQTYSKYNNGFKYILTVIDVFTKKAWAFPLKSKASKDVIAGFKRVFKENKPKYVQSDNGMEFRGADVQKFLKSLGIKYYHTNNPDIKASVVERYNRSLKEKMFKYLTFANTKNYVDVLPDLVDSYNNTKHSAINMTPNQVTKDNQHLVYNYLYGGCGRYPKYVRNGGKVKLKIDDKVRLTREKLMFEKGHEENWTQEVFKICEIVYSNPIRYKVKDLKNEDIEGTFYAEELQLVFKTDNDVFKIDKVLDSRGKGNSRELYVSWKGHPAKFNSWIKSSQLKKSKKNE